MLKTALMIKIASASVLAVGAGVFALYINNINKSTSSTVSKILNYNAPIRNVNNVPDDSDGNFTAELTNTPTNVNVSVNTNQKSNSTLNKNINKVANTNTSKKIPTAPTNSENANTSSNVNTNTNINAPSNVNVVEPSPTFIWPVSPNVGIYFHFSDEIGMSFRSGGLYFSTELGTPIIASADGTVVQVKNPDLRIFAYVLILHNDNHQTMSGYLSRIDVVKGQAVTQGQQIGISGGVSGTPGAGISTGGPKFYFELREKGIPVDPLPYLPPI